MFSFNSSYDLLVKNQRIQKSQSKKIFNFCNLNWEKDTLKYYKNIIPIQTVSIEQARKPVYQTSLKTYENYSEFLDFKEIDNIEREIFLNLKMVGRVGYAPTTPAMSMQYSTIELTAL